MSSVVGAGPVNGPDQVKVKLPPAEPPPDPPPPPEPLVPVLSTINMEAEPALHELSLIGELYPSGVD